MIRRLLEIFPGFLSWSILLAPILFSFWYPVTVTFFMAGFVFLWFFRTVEYIAFLLYSYTLFERTAKKDFSLKLMYWDTAPEHLPSRYQKVRAYIRDQNDFLKASEVEHIIIVATCGEEKEVLHDTFESIKESDFDRKKITVVLATEERMKPESDRIAEELLLEYGETFKAVYSFAHPLDIPGEVKGKGGNITHSGREITKVLESQNEDLKKYIVTTLDADNRLDPEYINALTFRYVATPDRQRSSYQPLPLFYNNIWDVPMINRMIAIAGGFWHMVESARPHRLHNFSSHAQPLWALQQMDFWATDTIVEDGHQYWRSYFHFKGDYFVEPLFVPIYQDAVLHTNWKTTLVAQYKQIRRWAWGASDIPFVILQWWKQRKEMPMFETFLHLLRLIESHIFWATAAIMITLATPVPRLLNPGFEQNGFDDGVAEILSFFFSLTFTGIFVAMLLSIITLPKPRKVIVFLGLQISPLFRYGGLILQWVFVPIMTIFFGALPALEAQTRLMFGKHLGFNVTKKVRKEEKTSEQKQEERRK